MEARRVSTGSEDAAIHLPRGIGRVRDKYICSPGRDCVTGVVTCLVKNPSTEKKLNGNFGVFL